MNNQTFYYVYILKSLSHPEHFCTGYTTDLDPADADGDRIGEPVSGLQIDAWNATSASWASLASYCSNVSGDRWQCTIDVAAEAQRFVFRGDDHVYIRLLPAAGSGNGPSLAAIDVDYGQLTVDYALP